MNQHPIATRFKRLQIRCRRLWWKLLRKRSIAELIPGDEILATYGGGQQEELVVSNIANALTDQEEIVCFYNPS